jgi:drug/metabolite transporter (DMT)-like permease
MREKSGISFSKTLFLTLFALVAFAANSVLCRLALGEDTIDAASFTIIRLLSGVIILLVIVITTSKSKKTLSHGSWSAAIMLFTYAVAFSFAYISLDTGTGALILFAAVQLTMILVAIVKGERLSWYEWAGMVIAFSGFVYLVLPGVSTPSLLGFILMTIAGIAWGIYTIMGKGSENPLADTTFNFTRTLPLVMVLFLLALESTELSPKGIILAFISGAFASAIGYTIWYMALKGLSSTQAAVVQLLVPVIAAAGGVFFMSEIITMRLLISALMILGGVTLVLI